MDEEEKGRSYWRRFEFAGITAAVTTAVFLLIGQSVEQIASQLAGTPIEMVNAKPKFNAIDYTTTGSVKGATVVIGPCDTHQP